MYFKFLKFNIKLKLIKLKYEKSRFLKWFYILRLFDYKSCKYGK